MGLLNELYEESENDYSKQQKIEVENKISKIQNFFKTNKISKWHIVVVGFGDHLLKDRNLKYRKLKDTFSVEEMKNFKGLNYGEYEFCYEHMAWIILNI